MRLPAESVYFGQLELFSSATLRLNVGLVHNMQKFNEPLFVTLFPLARLFIPTIATNPKNYYSTLEVNIVAKIGNPQKLWVKQTQEHSEANLYTTVQSVLVTLDECCVFSVVTCLQPQQLERFQLFKR